MPTSSEELTDTYVAELLARDAERVRNGTGGAVPRRKDAPKPNVRFLNSIIRDTKNHNSALLEREHRLQRDFAKVERRSREGEPPSKKRKSERPDRWAAVLSSSGILGETLSRQNAREDRRGRLSPPPEERKQKRLDRLQLARAADEERRQRRPRESSEPAKPARERSPKPLKQPDVHSHKQRYRSRSKSPNASEHPGRYARKKRSRSRSRSPRAVIKVRQRPSVPVQDTADSDSDPLEALVGPLPKSKLRGRGTTSGGSGIDARFADPAYDPRADVRRDDDEENEWEAAVAGMRQRLKQRSLDAERLLAAGFSEEEVQQWKSINATGRRLPDTEDIDNVVWTKKGEAREWDRGKILGEDVVVETKPLWPAAVLEQWYGPQASSKA